MRCFIREDPSSRRARLGNWQSASWHGHWLMARLLQPRLQCNLLCARGQCSAIPRRGNNVFASSAGHALSCSFAAAEWQSRDKSDTVTWNARQLINHPAASRTVPSSLSLSRALHRVPSCAVHRHDAGLGTMNASACTYPTPSPFDSVGEREGASCVTYTLAAIAVHVRASCLCPFESTSILLHLLSLFRASFSLSLLLSIPLVPLRFCSSSYTHRIPYLLKYRSPFAICLSALLQIRVESHARHAYCRRAVSSGWTVRFDGFG